MSERDLRQDYARRKEQARRIQAEQSQSGRDIGELPAVAHPRRRKLCEKNFLRFCETYFPETFYLKWSKDHITSAKKIERAVLKGGLFAFAMPRGFGKTTLCETAAIWAIIYGHRSFGMVVGATQDAANRMLDSIKSEFETNDLLFEDFPEACYPIRCLEGITQRANGQTYRGKRTYISWKETELVLPYIPEAKCAGAVIWVAGITGQIRGAKTKQPYANKPVRPDFVIVDDPQTDESAASETQNDHRLSVLKGAILGLAGPGRKIAGFMPCTVIQPGDMADQILDRDKNPVWQGERMKMLYTMPENEKLWDEYASVLKEELRAGGDGTEATKFYVEHREEMDKGATAAWQELMEPWEASAVQHAMNILITRGDAAFWAECQNEPLKLKTDATPMTADQIASKLNGIQHGVVPLFVTHLTAEFDIHENVLFYTLAGWDMPFTGAVVDYGTFPDQERASFTLRDSKRTLERAMPNDGFEARLYGGLKQLSEAILGKEWMREDGAAMRVERCLVDASWGKSTDIVYQFCRESRFASILIPSHGRYVGASSRPFSEYKRQRGDRIGHNWRIPSVTGKRAARHVLYDANYWKSFVFARLAVNIGNPGCLSLYGHRPEAHRLFAEHMTAEYPVRTEARGRVVDEWKQTPDKDNHWFDGLVGCAVGASICGAVLPGAEVVTLRPTMKMSDMQRRRRERVGA